MNPLITVLRQKARPWINGPHPSPLRAAAVGVIIVPQGNSGDILLVKRAAVRGDPWSGHVAFPGGKFHPNDGNLKNTLLRELHEEVGLDITARDVAGVIDETAPSNRPGLNVTAFLVILESKPRLKASEEIEAWVWADLYNLAKGHGNVGGDGEEAQHDPSYRVGRLVVWGMTARIIQRILSGVIQLTYAESLSSSRFWRLASPRRK